MTMSMQLEPLDRAKTYELVVRQIKAEIFAGRLRPGDRLPGERQLSEQLQVSRPSVREALRILQAMEIVSSQPGTGARSGLIISAEPSRALSDLLGIHVALSSYTVSDLMHVRLALECESVRRLATNSSTVDLGPLEQILDKLSSPGIDRQAFHDLDTEFHVALADSSGNQLLTDLMIAMREAVRRPMAKAFEQDEDWPVRQKELAVEHAQIFKAIAAGKRDEVIDLMRSHIEGFYEQLEAAGAV